MRVGSFWRGEMLPWSAAATKGNPGVSNPSASGAIAGDSAILDELLLSPEAEELLALPVMSDFSAQPGQRTSGPGSLPSLPPIQGNVEQLLEAFQKQFTDLLDQQGIDRQQEIRLSVASDGKVIVTNDHPRKAEIEQLLREPSLRNQFVELSAQTSLQQAVRESMEFQQAYRQDPLQAINEFSHLFTRSAPPEHTLSIVADQFTSLFV